MRFLLIRGVAIIDAASQRPGLAGRAVARVLLPGTSLALVERRAGGRGAPEQILDLGRRDEKGVTILLEPATPPAQPANRPSPATSPIELVVKCLDARSASRGSERLRRPAVRIERMSFILMS